MNPIREPNGSSFSRMERLSGAATNLTGGVSEGEKLFQASQSLKLGSSEVVAKKLHNTRQPGIRERISQLFSRTLERLGLRIRNWITRSSSGKGLPSQLSKTLLEQAKCLGEAFEEATKVGDKIGERKKEASRQIFWKVRKKILRNKKIPELKKKKLLQETRILERKYMSQLDQSLKKITETRQGDHISIKVPSFREEIKKILAELNE